MTHTFEQFVLLAPPLANPKLFAGDASDSSAPSKTLVFAEGDDVWERCEQEGAIFKRYFPTRSLSQRLLFCETNQITPGTKGVNCKS